DGAKLVRIILIESDRIKVGLSQIFDALGRGLVRDMLVQEHGIVRFPRDVLGDQQPCLISSHFLSLEVDPWMSLLSDDESKRTTFIVLVCRYDEISRVLGKLVVGRAAAAASEDHDLTRRDLAVPVAPSRQAEIIVLM